MQQFNVILKNDKIKSYRRIALILLFLNLATFILLLFYDQYRYEAASAIFLVGIYIFMRLYFIRKYKQGNYLDQILMFVLAGCWLGVQNYLMVTILVILGIMYHLTLQKIQVVFTKDEIIKYSFPGRKYEWSLFNNVILKDRILTLDFKNNKLLQAEIENPESINEQAFNSFAQTQLG